jgi:peptidoglycan biosynthesis protein MviN/MurJ (putative lipid II flippase)
LVASVAPAYALGIVGYAGFLLVTRASYAAGDVRAPALVNLGVALGGSALMVGLFLAVSGTDKVVVLGFAYSAAVTAGAALLLVLVRRRAGAASPIAGALGRATVCRRRVRLGCCRRRPHRLARRRSRRRCSGCGRRRHHLCSRAVGVALA